MIIIHVARKPPKGTMSQNISDCGVGGLNIDACRIGSGEDKAHGGAPTAPSIRKGATRLFNGGIIDRVTVDCTVGRWPTNVLLSCTCGQEHHAPGCPVFELGGQSGESTSGGRGNTRINTWTASGRRGEAFQIRDVYPHDCGTAARFFKQLLDGSPT